ncbi:unnamed protein product [Rotaria magnacalcarata]|uniref:Uncharacterized protein n=1 Tax=Rotaria magnacalcarata TaxID=392030 RepID=A0A815EED3_9BILA|nr:unnamed protein product [Rotaria magnacalcarata]
MLAAVPTICATDGVNKPVVATRNNNNNPLKFGNSNRPYVQNLAAHYQHSFIGAFCLKRIYYGTYKVDYDRSLCRMMDTAIRILP